MRLQPIAIQLGDRQWQLRPLTLAQVQAVEPLVIAAAESKGTSVANAIAILRIALSRDHADAAASLDEVEAGAAEIGTAMGQVLRLGGFAPNGDPKPGEAGAGDPPAAPPTGSTGADFTPA